MHIRRYLLAAALSMAIGSAAIAQDAGTERQHFKLPEMAALNLPFSDAGGLDVSTMTAPEDPRDEARLLMENFIKTLALANMTLDDLVSVTVYCPDLSLYSVFNEVYASYFEGEFPARAFIGSGPLLFGMRFEMQAIAVK